MGADFIGASVPVSRTRDEAIKALHELNDVGCAPHQP
jgi:hypothetical protein